MPMGLLMGPLLAEKLSFVQQSGTEEVKRS
jgi:hypothetical protein